MLNATSFRGERKHFPVPATQNGRRIAAERAIVAHQLRVVNYSSLLARRGTKILPHIN